MTEKMCLLFYLFSKCNLCFIIFLIEIREKSGFEIKEKLIVLKVKKYCTVMMKKRKTSQNETHQEKPDLSGFSN